MPTNNYEFPLRAIIKTESVQAAPFLQDQLLWGSLDYRKSYKIANISFKSSSPKNLPQLQPPKQFSKIVNCNLQMTTSGIKFSTSPRKFPPFAMSLTSLLTQNTLLKFKSKDKSSSRLQVFIEQITKISKNLIKYLKFVSVEYRIPFAEQLNSLYSKYEKILDEYNSEISTKEHLELVSRVKGINKEARVIMEGVR